MERRLIVGLMGGDHVTGAKAADAEQAGASLTSAQVIVLTGGCGIDHPTVKDAAMRGAKAEFSRSGAIARLVGILPGPQQGRPPVWDERERSSLFLETGLDHKERDVINGVTPDVLIFFAGSSGTLCELTFALQAERPVLYWRAAKKLKEKYIEHTKDGEIDRYLQCALNACRTKFLFVPGINAETTVASLRATLSSRLSQAHDFSGDIVDLAAQSNQKVMGPKGFSGFPGFREDPDSKERFESIIQRISK